MSGNPHCDYVQSCLYINPEVQNASDNLKPCIRGNGQSYVQSILKQYNLGSLCTQPKKTIKHKEKLETNEKDKPEPRRQKGIEAMVDEGVLIDEGPGEVILLPGQLPEPFLYKSMGLPVKVCNNCTTSNKTIPVDMCFESGGIYDGIDNYGNMICKRTFNDRMLKMVSLL